MTAELVGAASLIVMLVLMCFAINMYLAVIAACERRALAYPVQGAEMEEQQRVSRGAAERRRRAVRRRHMETVNHSAGNQADPQEHDERFC